MTSVHDHERFDRLYRENASQILSYATRRVTARDHAADVVAETFLVAWRKLDQVPDNHESLFWLYGVARRVLLNLDRREARQHRIGESLRQFLRNEPDKSTLTVEVIDTRRALAALSDDDAEIMKLSAWEGLNATEISAVLGMPAATVRTRLARARKRLKSALEDEQ